MELAASKRVLEEGVAVLGRVHAVLTAPCNSGIASSSSRGGGASGTRQTCCWEMMRMTARQGMMTMRTATPATTQHRARQLPGVLAGAQAGIAGKPGTPGCQPAPLTPAVSCRWRVSSTTFWWAGWEGVGGGSAVAFVIVIVAHALSPDGCTNAKTPCRRAVFGHLVGPAAQFSAASAALSTVHRKRPLSQRARVRQVGWQLP